MIMSPSLTRDLGDADRRCNKAVGGLAGIAGWTAGAMCRLWRRFVHWQVRRFVKALKEIEARGDRADFPLGPTPSRRCG
jgi:hypothetical protein